jgi:predicted acyltransferase (DUF342 family)
MDDLVINVRQILQYPQKAQANADDALLVQNGGLGGPYQSVTAYGLVVGALDWNGATLGIGGVQVPPDAVGAGVLAVASTTYLGCSQGFNWYNNAVGGQSSLQGGGALMSCFDGANWSLNVGSATANAPITNWVETFALGPDGSLSLAGNLGVAGDLGVNGSASIDGDLGVGGNATVEGTLGVAGDVQLDGVLTVSSDINGNGNLNLVGAATIGGPLNVSGLITGSGGAAISGGLTTDSFTATSGATITNGLNTDYLTVTYTAAIGSDTTIGGNLALAGSASLASDVAIGGTLGVAGDVGLSSDLSVSGDGTFGGALAATHLTLSQYITAHAAQFSGNVTMAMDLAVAGNQSIGGSLALGQDLDVGGSSLLGGDLTVSGVTRLKGNAFTVTPPQTAFDSEIVDARWVRQYVKDHDYFNVGPLPPANPVVGTPWFDLNCKQGYVWTGNRWMIIVNPPLGAPIYSPRFWGTPRAPTPGTHDNSTRIATTAFTHTLLDYRTGIWEAEVMQVRDMIEEYKGIPGPRGFRGRRGFTGYQGPQGEIGPIGIQGPIGLRGYRGFRGERGFTGMEGPPGDVGPAGVRGPIGPIGPEGPPGVGFILRGSKNSVGELPHDAEIGDGWVVAGTVHVWDGEDWVPIVTVPGPYVPLVGNSTITGALTLTDNLYIDHWNRGIRLNPQGSGILIMPTGMTIPDQGGIAWSGEEGASFRFRQYGDTMFFQSYEPLGAGLPTYTWLSADRSTGTVSIPKLRTDNIQAITGDTFYTGNISVVDLTSVWNVTVKNRSDNPYAATRGKLQVVMEDGPGVAGFHIRPEWTAFDMVSPDGYYAISARAAANTPYMTFTRSGIPGGAMIDASGFSASGNRGPDNWGIVLQGQYGELGLISKLNNVTRWFVEPLNDFGIYRAENQTPDFEINYATGNVLIPRWGSSFSRYTGTRWDYNILTDTADENNTFYLQTRRQAGSFYLPLLIDSSGNCTFGSHAEGETVIRGGPLRLYGGWSNRAWSINMAEGSSGTLTIHRATIEPYEQHASPLEISGTTGIVSIPLAAVKTNQIRNATVQSDTTPTLTLNSMHPAQVSIRGTKTGNGPSFDKAEYWDVMLLSDQDNFYISNHNGLIPFQINYAGLVTIPNLSAPQISGNTTFSGQYVYMTSNYATLVLGANPGYQQTFGPYSNRCAQNGADLIEYGYSGMQGGFYVKASVPAITAIVISQSTGNVNIRGVTDGSNAPAGCVGETFKIQETNEYNGGEPNVYFDVNIPAGDWLCWGTAFILTRGSPMSDQTYIFWGPGYTNGVWAVDGPGVTKVRAPLSVIRFNSSAPQGRMIQMSNVGTSVQTFSVDLTFLRVR